MGRVGSMWDIQEAWERRLRSAEAPRLDWDSELSTWSPPVTRALGQRNSSLRNRYPLGDEGGRADHEPHFRTPASLRMVTVWSSYYFL